MSETNALQVAGEVLAESDMQEIYKWIGRHQAFGLMANKSAGAQAECLKRIKESGAYKQLGMTWDAFCDKELGIPRRTADRLITQYEDFGAAYFAMSSVVRISPDTYRAIASAVTDDALQVEGETIAITKQNAPRIAQAIAQITKNLELERDAARGQLSDTKAAHTKAKAEAANARKAYEKSHDEFLAYKAKESALFPDATPNERTLLLAQTRIQDACRRIHEVAAKPDLSEAEYSMLKNLGNFAIKLIMEASGANPWDDLQMEQIQASDMVSQYTLDHVKRPL